MVGEARFKKNIWKGLIAIFAITIFFVFQITALKFDYDFEKFFPANDAETDYFLSYRKQFTSDNDFLLIAIEREDGIFDEKFLNKVSELTKEFESFEDIKFVTSITNQSEQLFFSSGATDSIAYFNPQDFNAKRDSARIYKNKELINTLVANDAKSLCLFIRHTDYISKKNSDELANLISTSLDNYEFERTRVAGRTIGQKYYVEKMTFEMVVFVGLSAFLIIIFLFIAFRSVWGVLVPQVIIFASMIWVVGGMAMFEEPMNIVLSTLPSIMFVVSMSDVIHLVSRYLDALRVEDSVFEAIKIAVKEVGMATFLTSLTTSIGFFSLYFVNVQPIQVFGVVMGCGVLIAFALTFLTLPLLFYIFPGPKFVRESKKNHFWQKYLERGFLLILRRRKTILLSTSIIMLVSIVGLMQLKSNNFLMDDLSADEPLKIDFNFLDDHYGGIRPFELAVKVNDSSKSVWNKEILQTIDSVENYLSNVYKVQIKNSLVRMLKVINRSGHAGNQNYFKLPNKKRELRSYRRAIRIANNGALLKTIVDSTETTTRISGGIPDLGNSVVFEKNEKLLEFLESKTMNGAIEYRITGTAHLIDKNLKYMTVSLVKGLSVSVLIVALIIGFIYRSIPIMIISIITNLIPLIFIAGVMGYSGIDLKTSTSIVFTIAFGIAVDDTIHFLGKFKYELLKGKGKLYALKRTYLTTGKAMILTTFILCSGFLLLIFSSFLGTIYMGLLLCITLLVALIADLTILPVMLLLFYKVKPSKED
ncbi:MAG: MMPL family transporter [Flavobacteriales bacterium]|nr:MMPL family transporter [Flavobacteriales bacterium]